MNRKKLKTITLHKIQIFNIIFEIVILIGYPTFIPEYNNTNVYIKT